MRYRTTLIRGTTRALLRSSSASGTASPADPVNFLTSLVGMNFASEGQPFVQGPTKQSTNLQLMSYASNAQPFVRYLKV